VADQQRQIDEMKASHEQQVDQMTKHNTEALQASEAEADVLRDHLTKMVKTTSQQFGMDYDDKKEKADAELQLQGDNLQEKADAMNSAKAALNTANADANAAGEALKNTMQQIANPANPDDHAKLSELAEKAQTDKSKVMETRAEAKSAQETFTKAKEDWVKAESGHTYAQAASDAAAQSAAEASAAEETAAETPATSSWSLW